MRTRFPMAGIALCALPLALGAQRIRGVVRDSASSALLPGAVVSVVDSLGNPAGRTIADGAGGFTLPLGPGAARLHVIRIGYAPRDVPLPVARLAGDASISFSMLRIPPVLDAVRVVGTELCPGSVERGAAFQLWEQARAGLLAAVVAREAKPASATTLMFERGMWPNDNLIRRQRVTPRTGRTTKPFTAAAAPSTFAKNGYVDEDATGARTYNAPDEDVLLDESFAATHCFHLEASDKAHPDQAGLAFAPVKGRDTLVDVAGVIWIDRAAPALRTLEFRYVGLEPAADRSGTGGHLEFRTMPNGVTFIEYWTLRLPIMTQLEIGASSRTRPAPSRTTRRQDRFDYRVAEIIEAGGQVLQAKWDDSVRWEAPPTGLTGSVVQRGTQAPIANALITLRGTPDTVTADAAGRFTFTPIVAGRYTVVVTDTALSAFAPDRSETRVVNVARGQVMLMRTELAPLAGVIADVCKGQRMSSGTATLVGSVAPTDGTKLANAEVRGTWQAGYAVTGNNVVVISSLQQHSTVDDRGRFVLCGIARGRPVRLRVSRGAAFADTSVTMSDSIELESIDWRPRFRNAAAQEMATLDGIVVRDSSHVPVAGAEVSLAAGRSTVTDANGAFRIANVPSGRYALQIRHVGDEPAADSVTLLPGDDSGRVFSLRRAVVLDTVRTIAAASRPSSPKLRAFEERRREGLGGSFLSDSLLRQNEDRGLGDVLQSHVAALRIQRSANATYAMSSRDTRSGKLAMSGEGPPACFATVYLDGVLLYDKTQSSPKTPPPNLNDYPPSQLAGVEFYPGSASAPMSYRSGPCGVLLLWTR
ncbi:MAG: hypothetical protein JWM41_1319 [Gemmatimonadetes bacterium]|nr:hypothetical protein [Gemmatimonadota bacterium]